MKRILMISLISILTILPFSACKEQGPMERTGERIDEAVEDIQKVEPRLERQGTFEELGESIDEVGE